MVNIWHRPRSWWFECSSAWSSAEGCCCCLLSATLSVRWPSRLPHSARLPVPQVPQKTGRPVNILHTGDCRWADWIRHQSILSQTPIDILYLDTTYALPKHVFPPQEEAIASMAAVMREAMQQEPATRFVIAAYHIGKENAFFGAAKAVGVKIYCNAAKCAVLHMCGLAPAELALLASQPEDASVHVTSWGVNPTSLAEHLDGDRVKQVCRWARGLGLGLGLRNRMKQARWW